MSRAALLCVAALAATGCGGPGGSTAVDPLPRVREELARFGATIEDEPDGWASFYLDGEGRTTGGTKADAAHVFLVTNRNELVWALTPTAVIAANGTYSSVAPADSTPKIVVISGTVDLSVNRALEPLGRQQFKTAAFDWDAYINAFKPSVWNVNPLNWNTITNQPFAAGGPLEQARVASSAAQTAVVKIRIGSNTSIFGINNAKVTNGMLTISAGVENVIIRNVEFADSYDQFPTWDPSDTYSLSASTPGCAMIYVNPGVGPQMCQGGRWNTNYDNIQITGGKHIWVDHCTFSDGDRPDSSSPSVFGPPHDGKVYWVQHHDGALDVTNTSDYVTISYNRFHDHDKTTLVGGSDTANTNSGLGALSVTLHHNAYLNIGQRTPRVRFGKVHTYNNYIQGHIADLPTSTSKGMIAGISAGYLAQLYSENNVFEVESESGTDDGLHKVFISQHKAAPTSGTDPDVGMATYFFDTGSTLNGTTRDFFTVVNTDAVTAGRPTLFDTNVVWTPSGTYSYHADPASEVKAIVTAKAGAVHSEP